MNEESTSAPSANGDAPASTDMPAKDLPKWLTLGVVPIAALAAVLTAIFKYEWFAYLYTAKEGPIEFATVGVALIGMGVGIATMKYRHRLPVKWPGVWVMIFVLGFFYIAGEELSWGQHIFKWEAPDAIKGINRQDETNFHNLDTFYGTIFGRKPKQLVEIWTVIGCIIMPIVLWKAKKKWNPHKDLGYWVWPTFACLPSAILVTAVYTPHRISMPHSVVVSSSTSRLAIRGGV